MAEYEKYVNEKGEVAVLYSPEYGAGWYTWNSHKGLLFDKEIVQAVLDKDFVAVIDIAKRKYPKCCVLGAEQLTIEWMRPGTAFEIEEHNGYGRIERLGYGVLCA